MQATTPYLSQRLSNAEQSTFFTNVLKQFQKELELLCTEMYKGKESDVFSLIERSYIGLWNNAIVKLYSNGATTLQEFSVWNSKNKVVGRADLLVKLKLEVGGVYFLFEGKQREFDGKKYSDEEIEAFFRVFEQQAIKYYDAEKDSYEEKVYIVPLVFEWIRNQHRLKQVLNFPENVDDGQTDFYMVIHSGPDKSDSSGLMVYGKVMDPEKWSGKTKIQVVV